jgi:RHS repeat-associated protein
VASADTVTNRALYDWTYNRAGQVLTENSQVTGDPCNGTITYMADALGQLTGSTLASTTTTYGWDTATNRTSVQVGAGTPVTTTYDNANRPATGANPSVTYANDAEGRLTARSGQTMTWDRLGRLTAVKNAAGTVTLATYTYDPLDRLRTVDYGGGSRIRFRYVGTTTAATQILDDVAGTVSLHIGTGWGGERLLDWTGAGSNIRIYGENAHRDTTWLVSSAGAVSQALRYDPWGNPRGAVPAGYAPFRFQGSWHDATTDLSWVVTRWYAQAQGRLISEDTLLGTPASPASRHLYAYAEGNPVQAWDPDGMRPLPCLTCWRWVSSATYRPELDKMRFLRSIVDLCDFVPAGPLFGATCISSQWAIDDQQLRL